MDIKVVNHMRYATLMDKGDPKLVEVHCRKYDFDVYTSISIYSSNFLGSGQDQNGNE